MFDPLLFISDNNNDFSYFFKKISRSKYLSFHFIYGIWSQNSVFLKQVKVLHHTDEPQLW